MRLDTFVCEILALVPPPFRVTHTAHVGGICVKEYHPRLDVVSFDILSFSFPCVNSANRKRLRKKKEYQFKKKKIYTRIDVDGKTDV